LRYPLQIYDKNVLQAIIDTGKISSIKLFNLGVINWQEICHRLLYGMSFDVTRNQENETGRVLRSNLVH
jgi:hypothetical protein